MAASSAASLTNASSVRQVRKPRQRFRIHEGLCLLREVAAANPFENPQMWEEVLHNVIAAVEPDICCAISGTEEQYGELQQLLQEVSDLAREFNYEPRTRSKKNGTAAAGNQARQATPPAAAELRAVQQLRDAAADCTNLPQQSDEHGPAPENETASSILLGIFDRDQRVPPEEGSCHTPEPVDNGQADEGIVQGSDDVEAFVLQRQQAQRKRCRTQAAPRGLGALQTLGLELLSRREEYEFELRKQEIQLPRRRLEHDKRRLLLDEAKHKHCGRRHFTPLCDPPTPPSDESTPIPVHSTALLSNYTKNSALLQPAQVWVNGPHRKNLARFLSDGGSQRPLVMEYISRELNLEVIGEKEVTICPFGGVMNVMKSKQRIVSFQKSAGCEELFSMAQSAVSTTLHAVSEAIISAAALKKLVQFPLMPAAKQRTKAAFSRWGYIPGMLACFDGTLIAIEKPKGLSTESGEH
ncbi:hypothetical protein HPB50_005017 [Hyalomma asiaticum]|uniref:Uncharacterized protein n=1 Tax=Hyalomma asiaticum TaxID=266040 RepID=A0ACB7SJF5_HYAAI|nr:hypothetical protein HPB50_005017 [Hyalomma asiaticum]